MQSEVVLFSKEDNLDEPCEAKPSVYDLVTFYSIVVAGKGVYIAVNGMPLGSKPSTLVMQ